MNKIFFFGPNGCGPLSNELHHFRKNIFYIICSCKCRFLLQNVYNNVTMGAKYMWGKIFCDSGNLSENFLALVIFIRPHLLNLFVLYPMKGQPLFLPRDSIP